MSLDKLIRKIVREECEAAVAAALSGGDNASEETEEEDEEEEEPKPQKKKAAKKKSKKKAAKKAAPKKEETEDDEFGDDDDNEEPMSFEDMMAPIKKAVNAADDREAAMKASVGFIKKKFKASAFKELDEGDRAEAQAGVLDVIAAL